VNDLTHLDLFSGIGGFALGFEAAGFTTLAFAETDPAASRVLEHHWPGIPNLGDANPNSEPSLARSPDVQLPDRVGCLRAVRVVGPIAGKGAGDLEEMKRNGRDYR